MKWICFYLFLVTQMGVAAVQISIDQIGPHFEVFRFEKSENPQNILVIFTKLDSECRFAVQNDNFAKPVFGFYWLMGGKKYKPVHSMIQSGIAERLQLVIPPNFPQSLEFFSVRIKDLAQIDSDLGNALVRVQAIRASKGCEVKATFNFEESSSTATITGNPKNSNLVLEKIHAESEKTVLPPFRKLVSLRFEGSNEKTGDPEQRFYQADLSP